MKIYKICMVALLGFTAVACNDWLAVEPKFRIDEEKIFSTEDGFKEGLLGVYDKMGVSNLYGKKLTMEFVDILGQRYNTAILGFEFRHAGEYNYKSANVTPQIESIWTAAYNGIANCNNVLDQIVVKKDLFTGNNFDLIRGELYGLRAFLHFDLLRLFGPVDVKPGGQKCLRYYDHFSLDVLPPFLTADEFMQKVLADIKSAETLLAEDMIKSVAPRATDPKDSFWSYRFNRMNYYALLALKARVLLYAGNLPEAKITAEKVIAASKESRGEETVFPWVRQGEADSRQDPDRIFHKEVIFGLYITSLPLWQEDIYVVSNRTYVLAPYKERLAELFPNATDYRSNWFGYIPTLDDKVVLKYTEPVNRNKYTFEKVMPMIRLSEMYLIVAECTASSPDAILNYVNPIVENRRLLPYAETENLEEILTLEYAREFFAEGQLFYYYKRKNMASIRNGSEMKMLTMKPENYVLPLPVSELKYTDGGELK